MPAKVSNITRAASREAAKREAIKATSKAPPLKKAYVAGEAPSASSLKRSNRRHRQAAAKKQRDDEELIETVKQESLECDESDQEQVRQIDEKTRQYEASATALTPGSRAGGRKKKNKTPSSADRPLTAKSLAKDFIESPDLQKSSPELSKEEFGAVFCEAMGIPYEIPNHWTLRRISATFLKYQSVMVDKLSTANTAVNVAVSMAHASASAEVFMATKSKELIDSISLELQECPRLSPIRRDWLKMARSRLMTLGVNCDQSTLDQLTDNFTLGVWNVPTSLICPVPACVAPPSNHELDDSAITQVLGLVQGRGSLQSITARHNRDTARALDEALKNSAILSNKVNVLENDLKVIRHSLWHKSAVLKEQESANYELEGRCRIIEAHAINCLHMVELLNDSEVDGVVVDRAWPKILEAAHEVQFHSIRPSGFQHVGIDMLPEIVHPLDMGPQNICDDNRAFECPEEHFDNLSADIDFPELTSSEDTPIKKTQYVNRSPISVIKSKRVKQEPIHVTPAMRHNNKSLNINKLKLPSHTTTAPNSSHHGRSPKQPHHGKRRKGDSSTSISENSESESLVPSSLSTSAIDSDDYMSRPSGGKNREWTHVGSKRVHKSQGRRTCKFDTRQKDILKAIDRDQMKNLQTFEGRNGDSWDIHVANSQVVLGSVCNDRVFFARVLSKSLRNEALRYFSLRIGTSGHNDYDLVMKIMQTSPWGDSRSAPTKLYDVLNRKQRFNEDTLEYLHDVCIELMPFRNEIKGWVLATFLMKGLSQQAYDHVQRNNKLSHADAVYDSPEEFLTMASLFLGEDTRGPRSKPSSSTQYSPYKKSKGPRDEYFDNQYDRPSRSNTGRRAPVEGSRNLITCTDCHQLGHRAGTTACKLVAKHSSKK
jgi:hypothetical protein